MKDWSECKNLLVVRLDNMGDLLMSTPAINALKKTFDCKISLLTSSAAKGVAELIEPIDEVIIFDVPWVKVNQTPDVNSCFDTVDLIKSKNFDGALIFSVFSQNVLPTALLIYLAQIPLRLAYCRENPYHLLTHWVPDKEPYEFIKHQVRRDLDLVKHIGAAIADEKISIRTDSSAWEAVKKKLSQINFDITKQWMIVHPGASEEKRRFPLENWIETVRHIVDQLDYQILITGTETERPLGDAIKLKTGKSVFSIAGLLTLSEFVALVHRTSIVLSVNTATIHIAAATQTKVIVLYAMTNPQHTPWQVPFKVFPFEVPMQAKSKNEVLSYVSKNYFPSHVPYPSPSEILEGIRELISEPFQQGLEVIDFIKLTSEHSSPNFMVTKETFDTCRNRTTANTMTEKE
jgi:ADP-heptose:LPS heptosyltransferase